MLTRWHKTFHVLVFGSIAALAVVVFVLRQEFSAQFSVFDNAEPRTTRMTYDIVEKLVYPPDDTKGGASPEETYLLFLGALKTGMIAEATEYFVPGKAGEWRSTLENFAHVGALPQLMAELEALPAAWHRKDPENGIAVFATASQTVTFVQNPTTFVWKLYSL